MSIRRFIQQNDGSLVEVDPNYIALLSADSGALWGDRQYANMGDPRFHSRTSHREFMRRTNVTTVDDFDNSWRESERRRLEYRQGQAVGNYREPLKRLLGGRRG
jgi:hypothetical protein